ncbi:MAG: hypothetical protein JXA25_14595 [Anaerolineales bacterium]|nr:hypothetical protein [Anaerolineales bacterium]
MSVRAYFGAVLLFLGAGFLGETLSIWQFSSYLAAWWPMLIILLGVMLLVTRSISVFAGAFITFFGLLLQLSLIPGLPISFGAISWPLILIFLGSWLILSRTSLFPGWVSSDEEMNYFAAFSGLNERIRVSPFESASVTAIFGGGDVDISESTLAPEGARIEINCIFGGIKLRVPQNCIVRVTGVPLFGGWENKTVKPESSETAPDLSIQVFAAFGGVDIFN